MTEARSVTIPAEAIEKIEQMVEMETRQDLYAFITDAINSYMHLGALHAQGCRFYARQDQDGEEGDLVQLRFPFDELVRNGAT